MALAPNWSAADKEAFLRSQFHLQHTHYQAHYPGARFDVITAQAEDIGRLYVAPLAQELRLMDIALLPQWRNRGIGAALVREVMAEAAGSGRAVTLHVEAENPARRLYERLGFVDAGETGVYTRMQWRAPASGAEVAR